MIAKRALLSRALYCPPVTLPSILVPTFVKGLVRTNRQQQPRPQDRGAGVGGQAEGIEAGACPGQARVALRRRQGQRKRVRRAVEPAQSRKAACAQGPLKSSLELLGAVCCVQGLRNAVTAAVTGWLCKHSPPRI